MHYTSVLDFDRPSKGIALESETLSNMVSSIKKFFPDLQGGYDTLARQLTTSFGAWGTASKTDGLSRLEKRVVEHLESFPYDDLAVITIPVPEGFNGNLLDYSRLLADSLEYYNTVTSPAADEMYTIVAGVLSNRSFKQSLKDETRKFRELSKSREMLNGDLTKSFARGANTPTSKFGRAFQNNAQVVDVFQYAKEFRQKLKGIDFDTVKAKGTKIADVIALLIKQTEKPDAGMTITPEAAKNVSEGAYEIARQLEFFSVNIFRIVQFLSAVDALAERLDRRFT